MRCIILLLVGTLSFTVHGQDLEFTWLRSNAVDYRQFSEFMDVAIEESGNILLTGSEQTCYEPIVVRLDSSGRLLQSKTLLIRHLNYGRGVRILSLGEGKSVIAAWGGLADDVVGKNAYVIFLDSLFNVIAQDTFESHVGQPAPPNDYYHMNMWTEGDSLMVAAVEQTYPTPYNLNLLTFDLNTLSRIRADSFEVPETGLWDDGKLSIIPFLRDTLVLGYNHSLLAYEKGSTSAVFSDSLNNRILDIERVDEEIWMLTEQGIVKLDRNLNEIFRQDFPALVEDGFFVHGLDTLYAIHSKDSLTTVSTIPFGSGIANSFSTTLPDVQFNEGVFHPWQGLVLAGQNVIKGIVKRLVRNSSEDDDIDIVSVYYSNERYDDQAGNFDNFLADANVVVKNRSNHVIDSFSISASGLFGENCFSWYFIKTEHGSIAPGQTDTAVLGVQMVYIQKGVPKTLEYCFTVYGPNGKIDEAKEFNTYCQSLVYTNIPTTEKETSVQVWGDLSTNVILVRSSLPELAELAVYNMAGQKVISEHIHADLNQIDHNLPPGIYVWQIRNANGELIRSDKLMSH